MIENQPSSALLQKHNGKVVNRNNGHLKLYNAPRDTTPRSTNPPREEKPKVYHQPIMIPLVLETETVDEINDDEDEFLTITCGLIKGESENEVDENERPKRKNIQKHSKTFQIQRELNQEIHLCMYSYVVVYYITLIYVLSTKGRM